MTEMLALTNCQLMVAEKKLFSSQYLSRRKCWECGHHLMAWMPSTYKSWWWGKPGHG
jgi:hypothetical protein